MRILANENFPGDAVAALRERGHDVAWVRTDSPGISDREVAERAIAEERVLITFDKDFGELAFHHGLAPSCGVILLRVSAPSAAHVGETVADLLDSRSDWEGNFAVITDDRIRLRPLLNRSS